MKIDQKGSETVRRVVNGLKNQYKRPKLCLKNTGCRQKIAIWTNEVSHLHHEIKELNIWLLRAFKK